MIPQHVIDYWVREGIAQDVIERRKERFAKSIQLRNATWGRTRLHKRPKRKELVELNQDMDGKTLAIYYGVSKSTIYRWFRELGLEIIRHKRKKHAE